MPNDWKSAASQAADHCHVIGPLDEVGGFDAAQELRFKLVEAAMQRVKVFYAATEGHKQALGEQPGVRLVRNCFWLMVPVLAFNLLFAHALPSAFQPESFWRDIPLGISVPENVLRGLVFALPLLMPLSLPGASARAPGIVMYSIGLLLYVASWTALIRSPTGPWSTNAVGFMAPAWTPLFGFVGIAWLSEERLFVSIGFYRRWMYMVACLLFLLFHNAHAALVFSRQP